MYRNNRLVDPNFQKDERLYYRCQEDFFDEKGNIVGSSIKFPTCSVNRGKYSKPEDVLLPDYLNWGIVEFQVGNIPAQLKTPDGKEFDFKVEHDPTEENYSHSEIRTYKDGLIPKTNKQVADSVKKSFRTIVSQYAVVLKQPGTITILKEEEEIS